MSIEPVLSVLRQRAGLEPASLGSTAVQAGVEARLRARGLDAGSYADRLGREPAELLALLDEVVVPETWFFRGGPLFYHLAQRLRAAGRPSRVLSLPCSTGEEPYSLALALLELGVDPETCAIHGIDASPRNVAAALAGVYGEMSFRQTDPAVRERHFAPVAGGWRIGEPARRAVRFAVGNVVDPSLLLFERPYDVVFCRNLLIYLTPEARRQALTALARLLTPGGLLCVGHAEPLDPNDGRFRRTGAEGLFLYQRVASGEQAAPAIESRPPQTARPRQEAVAPPREAGPTLDAMLGQARQQADVGQHAQALALCGTIQERFGPSADVYSLAGVIHQARQEREAAAGAFRKALYLEPNHREALMHFMLLCQQHGDQAQAALLRKRLERLVAGGER